MRTSARSSGLRLNKAASLRSGGTSRSEEHTSELQSQSNLVCRLLLEKKKKQKHKSLKNEHQKELNIAKSDLLTFLQRPHFLMQRISSPGSLSDQLAGTDDVL